MRTSFVLATVLLLAGCMGSPSDQPLASGTYHMTLSGMPSGPVAPGATFSIHVDAQMGSGMRMHERDSDHIGAHFWNATQAEPTMALASAAACGHTAGSMPGDHMATCTAPMQPGTYHLRAHARMNETGTLHHWWSAEQTFTVA